MTLRLETFKQLSVHTPAARLSALFGEITDEEADPDWRGSIHLIFSDDSAVRKLNRRFRNKNSATDVLSFVLDKPDGPQSVFGEIYISVTSARRQASQYGGGVYGEMLRLFCHGLLHLLGYDHQNESESKRMQMRESYFLAKAGERFYS